MNVSIVLVAFAPFQIFAAERRRLSSLRRVNCVFVSPSSDDATAFQFLPGTKVVANLTTGRYTGPQKGEVIKAGFVRRPHESNSKIGYRVQFENPARRSIVRESALTRAISGAPVVPPAQQSENGTPTRSAPLTTPASPIAPGSAPAPADEEGMIQGQHAKEETKVNGAVKEEVFQALEDDHGHEVEEFKSGDIAEAYLKRVHLDFKMGCLSRVLSWLFFPSFQIKACCSRTDKISSFSQYNSRVPWMDLLMLCGVIALGTVLVWAFRYQSAHPPSDSMISQVKSLELPMMILALAVVMTLHFNGELNKVKDVGYKWGGLSSKDGTTGVDSYPAMNEAFADLPKFGAFLTVMIGVAGKGVRFCFNLSQANSVEDFLASFLWAEVAIIGVTALNAVLLGCAGASFEPKNVNASFGHVGGICVDVVVKCAVSISVVKWYYSDFAKKGADGDAGSESPYQNVVARWVSRMSTTRAKIFFFASHIVLDYYQQKVTACTPDIANSVYKRMWEKKHPDGYLLSAQSSIFPKGIVYWFADIEAAVSDARVSALWGSDEQDNYSQKRGALLTLAQSADTRPDWTKVGNGDVWLGRGMTALLFGGGSVLGMMYFLHVGPFKPATA